MKILEWLLASSADASRLSLTVKGVLLGAIPVLITLGGAFGIHLPDSGALTSIADLIGQLIQVGLGIVAALVTAWGLLRKIWKTWNGTNKTLEN